jgi:hypothetical protein
MSGGIEDAARRQKGLDSELIRHSWIDVADKCKKESVYEKLGCDIGRLVDQKQIAYGDSFNKSGEIMEVIFPNGIPFNMIRTALYLVRDIDKMVRIATNNDPFGENPVEDRVGYGLLEIARQNKTKESHGK